MQSNDQKRVFKSVPQGVRKIVGTGMPIDKSNISILLHCCLALYNLQMPFILCFRFWQLILRRLALLSMMLYMWLIQGKWKRYLNWNLSNLDTNILYLYNLQNYHDDQALNDWLIWVFTESLWRLTLTVNAEEYMDLKSQCPAEKGEVRASTRICRELDMHIYEYQLFK